MLMDLKAADGLRVWQDATQDRGLQVEQEGAVQRGVVGGKVKAYDATLDREVDEWEH